MLSTRRWLIAVAGGLVASLVAGAMPAAAQKWPQRAVKFIVPLGPGSGVDIGTRLVADKLSKKWGQPTVVENRPGGDGLLAINAFVTGNDDHVLLASPSSSFTHHPHVYKNLSYKPSDLVPIARLSNTIIAVAVPASLPVKSLADVAAMARAEPGKLNWAGTTGGVDFVVAGFLKTAGLDMSKVPYRNPVEAANDVAAERVQFYAAAYAIVRHAAAGTRPPAFGREAATAAPRLTASINAPQEGSRGSDYSDISDGRTRWRSGQLPPSRLALDQCRPCRRGSE